MSNLIVKMDAEDRALLERLAKNRKTTMSSVIRELVRKAAAEEKRKR